MILPPPELHLLLGPVNKLVDSLTAVWPECEQWTQACNVVKDEYHGSSMKVFLETKDASLWVTSSMT